ncbi:hypothetical protein [Sphingomonas sp. Leaf242]|uniref:hypothetical protein n=1 Tax=Sphingomonas sp. Leaf242 TaxID=1736304 RepID=UPI000714A095|nr:hypothetical protein [Sphingomonas sp. Leaf242]KQO06914.1 hypothetical protein ASF09_11680 [Sphingomonas sp. Leaf242]
MFNDQSDLKSLYSWSLNELDDAGVKVGSDYIPWQWTLNFKAKSVVLNDKTQIGDRYAEPDAEPGAKTKRTITASLYPDEHSGYAPRYSMLGTERTITDFNLFIEEADAKGERCAVWGGVSYTSDIDFRDVTQPDTVAFYLYVNPDRFQEYALRIEARQVDSIALRVGGVNGFYANWSPGISTNEIKVLTRDRKHEVQNAKDDVPLSRLGEVEEAELFLVTTVDLPVANPADEPDEEEVTHDNGRPIDRAAQLEALRDRRAQDTLKMITSLRMAAWTIAAFLLISFFVHR